MMSRLSKQEAINAGFALGYNWRRFKVVLEVILGSGERHRLDYLEGSSEKLVQCASELRTLGTPAERALEGLESAVAACIGRLGNWLDSNDYTTLAQEADPEVDRWLVAASSEAFADMRWWRKKGEIIAWKSRTRWNLPRVEECVRTVGNHLGAAARHPFRAGSTLMDYCVQGVFWSAAAQTGYCLDVSEMERIAELLEISMDAILERASLPVDLLADEFEQDRLFQFLYMADGIFEKILSNLEPDKRPRLSVRLDEHRPKFLLIGAEHLGEQWKIDMGVPGGERNVLYRHLRLLFLQLQHDINDGKPDDETGWVDYEELSGQHTVKAPGKLRTQMRRLRGRLSPLEDVLQVPYASRKRQCYRLEGRVLKERWLLEIDLPEPDS